MSDTLLFDSKSMFTVLCAAFPHARQTHITKYAVPLFDTIRRYDIFTELRLAHFLAQVGHESGELKFAEELASGAAYEGRRDLGNTQPGDGRLFKGRGLIQLTGRINVERYADSLTRETRPLYVGPQSIATEPMLAADTAGWFWSTKHLNDQADLDSILSVTRKVNGGYNGLADRRRLLDLAKEAVGRENAMRLQAALNWVSTDDPRFESCYMLKVDGKFGPRTRSALRDAQANLGLEPSGQLDKTTAEVLSKEANV